MAFLTENEPPRGVAESVLPGIRRIVAGNVGPMTYHGTNTYIFEHDGETIVLDPGPDDASHVEAILKATGGRVDRILLSHSHHDHLGAAPALRQATGALACGFAPFAEPDFALDVGIEDGGEIAGLVAVHTPGHAPDHICFARADGLLFTGDHVMSWSTTVVPPPPRGNMVAFFASLRRLIARDDRLYLPGHGPALSNPRPYVQDLLSRREAREAAIARALGPNAISTAELMDRLYSKVDPILRRAAERNVMSHLVKLEAEGRAERDGESWRLPAA